MLFLVFFFKQKTAYEMRISDWSSDVCSSDLPFSTPIGYAVSAKPIAAMDANGRDGKRSGVIPLTSLVVSQKNWKVRFSMSLNSGGSAGRCPATSCCTGSGGGSTGCVAAGSTGCCCSCGTGAFCGPSIFLHAPTESTRHETRARSEEHTSEL